MATTHQNETVATQSEFAVVEKARLPSQPQFESISFLKISRRITGSNAVERKTEIQDQVEVPWSCIWPEISPIHHHCRLHGVVGHAISKFGCTKQLVTAVFDTLQGALDLTYALYRTLRRTRSSCIVI